MSATDQKPPQQGVQVQVKTYHRLSSSQYMELEKKAISRISFRDETQPVQAGYMVGVEAVLRLVREGFTVS